MTGPCRLAVVVGLLCVVPSSALAQAVGKRYALLIGVNKYQSTAIPSLAYVDNDIRDLQRVLTAQGYEVTTVPNDRAYRHVILRELYSHAARLTESDTFVLYYAGHGIRNVEINRKTYWVTYDTDLGLLDVDGIRLEHLVDYISDIHAGRKLILLDHCFSGDAVGLIVSDVSPAATLAPASPPPTIDPAAALRSGPQLRRHANPVATDLEKEVEDQANPADRGTVVVAAATRFATEAPAFKHGVFTLALIEACSTRQADGDSSGLLSIPELVSYAKGRVKKLLGDANMPPQNVTNRGTGDVLAQHWELCQLPVEAPEELARARQRYLDTLSQWALKRLIDDGQKALATDVVEKWVQAHGKTDTLSDAQRRVLVGVRWAIDGTGAEEAVRANTLLAYIESSDR
jgi:uncharacterized caspase-like protein